MWDTMTDWLDRSARKKKSMGSNLILLLWDVPIITESLTIAPQPKTFSFSCQAKRHSQCEQLATGGRNQKRRGSTVSYSKPRAAMGMKTCRMQLWTTLDSIRQSTDAQSNARAAYASDLLTYLLSCPSCQPGQAKTQRAEASGTALHTQRQQLL